MDFVLYTGEDAHGRPIMVAISKEDTENKKFDVEEFFPSGTSGIEKVGEISVEGDYQQLPDWFEIVH